LNTLSKIFIGQKEENVFGASWTPISGLLGYINDILIVFVQRCSLPSSFVDTVFERVP